MRGIEGRAEMKIFVKTIKDVNCTPYQVLYLDEAERENPKSHLVIGEVFQSLTFIKEDHPDIELPEPVTAFLRWLENQGEYKESLKKHYDYEDKDFESKDFESEVKP
jgi:hypothetical protein